MKKLNFIFFITATAGVISFDLYKAAHASFTHDESYTYLHFVNTNIMDIISYFEPFTNNHILNTLLMKFSQALLGTSELTLRLPNILSHLLYMIFIFKLFDRYCNKYFILFFILLNANPFLLDFFSLARGYGIAIGLMTAGLYYYCRYIENQKIHNHILSLVLIGFASLANFTLLNIFLILILMHNLFQFIINRRPFSLKNLWKINRINVMIGFVFSMILYEPIRKIIKYKLIDFGGMEGFWHDTAGTLAHAFAYDVLYRDYMIVFFKMFFISFSVLFLLRIIKYFFKKNPVTLVQKFGLFFGLILFFLIDGTILQHYLLGTPYLELRFALFMYPLFIFMCCFLIADFMTDSYKYLKGGFIVLITATLFLHTGYAINTSSYFEWKYDMHTKEMLKDIDRVKPKECSQIKLGITWIFEPTVNFYKETLNLNWLSMVDRNGLKPEEHDYYYISPEDMNIIDTKNIEIIHCYPDFKNCLVRNNKKSIRKKKIQLKAINDNYICADSTLNHLIFANKEKAGLCETFSLIIYVNNKCAIRSYDDHYFCAELDHKNQLTTYVNYIAAWETFTLVELDGNFVAFKAVNGKYITIDEKTLQLFARSKIIGKREKFEIIIK
ncbi:MAG: hypothetical protein HY958_05885 [Bacteroidia bacterium]|nr:hypothetical protein [Bacteroidia bacterium]